MIALHTLLHSLEEIVDLSAIDAALVVTDMTLDSRSVTSGALFVALEGTQQHGLHFLDDAIKNGAAAIIWESSDTITEDERKYYYEDCPIPCIEVAELSSSLGYVADRFFDSPSQSLKMVGVTGTDGKTSVTHFIAQALNALDWNAAVIGTIGIGSPYHLQEASLTTPDVISVHRYLRQLCDDGIGCVAMEVSSHALDQGRVGAVDFDIVVLTNLTRDHLDYHGTMEAYSEAKARLFQWPTKPIAVINGDDVFGQQLFARMQQDHNVLVYGTQLSALGDAQDSIHFLEAKQADFSVDGICADVCLDQEDEGSLSANLLGDFNLHNVLACMGVLTALGFTIPDAIKAIAHLRSVPGRMEAIEKEQGKPLVVVDYAHTPGALESALLAIRQHTSGRIICVFGCGGDRDKGKRPLMGQIAESLSELVVITDDNPRTESPFMIMNDIISGLSIPEHVAVEHNRAKAIHYAINKAEETDVVLIAGKGHEAYQLIDGESHHFDDREQARQVLKGEQG